MGSHLVPHDILLEQIREQRVGQESLVHHHRMLLKDLGARDGLDPDQRTTYLSLRRRGLG